MSHRLFIALRPPPEVRQRLLSVMSGIDGARWQSDAQLHLTLAFAGMLDGDRAEAVAEALHRIQAPSLALRLGAFGTFPGRRPDLTSALWIGVTPAAGLAALASRVRRACAGAGVMPDNRAFVPHITLARFSGSGASRAQLAPYLRSVGAPPGQWAASRFYLVESFPGHGGPHYEAVASYRLLEAGCPL